MMIELSKEDARVLEGHCEAELEMAEEYFDKHPEDEYYQKYVPMLKKVIEQVQWEIN